MKIAATVTSYIQVSQSEYRDIRKTMIFDSSQSLDEVMKWANSIITDIRFGEILFSEVVETTLSEKPHV